MVANVCFFVLFLCRGSVQLSAKESKRLALDQFPSSLPILILPSFCNTILETFANKQGSADSRRDNNFIFVFISLERVTVNSQQTSGGLRRNMAGASRQRCFHIGKLF